MIMCRLHDIPVNVHVLWCRLDFNLHMFLDNIHIFMCRYKLTKIVFRGEMYLKHKSSKKSFQIISQDLEPEFWGTIWIWFDHIFWFNLHKFMFNLPRKLCILHMFWWHYTSSWNALTVIEGADVFCYLSQLHCSPTALTSKHYTTHRIIYCRFWTLNHKIWMQKDVLSHNILTYCTL